MGMAKKLTTRTRTQEILVRLTIMGDESIIQNRSSFHRPETLEQCRRSSVVMDHFWTVPTEKKMCFSHTAPTAAASLRHTEYGSR